MPPLSRANVEQSYVDQEFGAFFRIDTGWVTPFAPEDANADIFLQEYLELVYWLQFFIENDLAEVNGEKYVMDDFCYKPITGEGCLVTSPMEYFKMNYTYLMS